MGANPEIQSKVQREIDEVNIQLAYSNIKLKTSELLGIGRGR